MFFSALLVDCRALEVYGEQGVGSFSFFFRFCNPTCINREPVGPFLESGPERERMTFSQRRREKDFTQKIFFVCFLFFLGCFLFVSCFFLFVFCFFLFVSWVKNKGGFLGCQAPGEKSLFMNFQQKNCDSFCILLLCFMDCLPRESRRP